MKILELIEKSSSFSSSFNIFLINEQVADNSKIHFRETIFNASN